VAVGSVEIAAEVADSNFWVASYFSSGELFQLRCRVSVNNHHSSYDH
jgi:hypothetical protein